MSEAEQFWRDVMTGLQDPFNISQIKWRLQTKPKDPNDPRALAVAYLDPRDIHERLDLIVGCDGWSFDWQPIVITQGKILAVKGTITIAGVSKSDIGTSTEEDTDPSKAAVTDALKRAAVLWGIGRHIYRTPPQWVRARPHGKSWEIDPEDLNRLRARKIA